MQQNSLSETLWVRDNLHIHAEALRRWLKSKYPNLEPVDDILQDAMLRVILERRRREVTKPKAFLFAVARNLAIDFLRRGRVVQFTPLDEFNPAHHERSSLGGRYSRELEKGEDLDILQEAIRRLPKRCRRVFTLRKIYQMSHQEIAETLGISVNTVQVHITLGLAKCRKYFDSIGE